MQIKKYIDKNGNERIYTYETSKYDKNYNKKRNKKIYNLQKRKSYYKKIGNLEKVEALELLIAIEKRKEQMNND